MRRTVSSEHEQPLPSPPVNAASITYRDNLAEVRQFVRMNAASAGLPTARIDDLVLATGELAANTLCHTAGIGTLHIWAVPAELLCQVHDSGHLADPLAGHNRPPPGASHGHGLWAVRQLSDAVDISIGPTGTTIRLHMHLGARPDTQG